MNKDALKLFLNECVATSLREYSELEGGLASTLQKRHKIRDTDLEEIFERANNTDPRTLHRWYLSASLILYSGAAYGNIESIANAAKGAIGLVTVKPHWSSSYLALKDIYKYEPMNLFPGWSLTNQRNNNYMLDPHYIFINDDGLGTDLHGEIRSGTMSHTEGMSIASHLFKTDVTALEQRMNSSSTRNQNRRLSVYSEQLTKREDTWEKNLSRIKSSQELTNQKQKNEKRLDKLIKELKRTTVAGENHYRNLLHSLLLQGFTTQDEVHISISQALCNWSTNRENTINTMGEIATIYLRMN